MAVLTLDISRGEGTLDPFAIGVLDDQPQPVPGLMADRTIFASCDKFAVYVMPLPGLPERAKLSRARAGNKIAIFRAAALISGKGMAEVAGYAGGVLCNLLGVGYRRQSFQVSYGRVAGDTSGGLIRKGPVVLRPDNHVSEVLGLKHRVAETRGMG